MIKIKAFMLLAALGLVSCNTPPNYEEPTPPSPIVDLTQNVSVKPMVLTTGEVSHELKQHAEDPNFYSGEMLIAAKTWVVYTAPPLEVENSNDMIIKSPGSDCEMYWTGLSYDMGTGQMKGRLSAIDGVDCPDLGSDGLFYSFYAGE